MAPDDLMKGHPITKCSVYNILLYVSLHTVFVTFAIYASSPQEFLTLLDANEILKILDALDALDADSVSISKF